MSEMNDEKQMPGLAEQGRNLVNLMKDVGEDIFAGQDIFVEQFEQKRRYDICQACPVLNIPERGVESVDVL